MSLRQMSNFFQRVIIGSFFSAFLLAAIYLSKDVLFQPLFALLTALVICGAVWEYYQISKSNGCSPVSSIGLLGSFLYVLTVYFAAGTPYQIDLAAALLLLILFFSFFSYFFSGVSPLINLAVTLFGVIYLTFPLSFLIPINFTYGRIWLVYLLCVTKFTDVGAYFIGKRWGRMPLAPVISPKKTWEGALGGFFIGTSMSYLLHVLSIGLYGEGLFHSSGESLIVGALMSVVAQVGDLFESLLKRDSGVKDSNSLPGLGGMLDMVDSLVFTTPLLYFFLKLSLAAI